jgi:threonine aldolase
MEYLRMKCFASDNFSGVHPEIMQALLKANVEHSMAYGGDPWSERARSQFSVAFEHHVEVFFAFNGTGANNLALRAGVSPWGRILCSECSHLICDESTAPAVFLGNLLSPVSAPQGKIDVEQLQKFLKHLGNPHQAQPQMISITQSTECGTLYSCDEIASICEFARAHGMFVHVDGARIANAVAASGVSLRKMLVDTGVDVVSFGGTKNGAMFGEAVVFLNPLLAKNFSYIHKMGMQLPSKTRFIAAQFDALLQNNLWLTIAKHANTMAKIFEREALKHPDVRILYPVLANAVFAELPQDLAEQLKQRSFFWGWNNDLVREGHVGARFMTTFDTTEEEILAFWGSL